MHSIEELENFISDHWKDRKYPNPNFATANGIRNQYNESIKNKKPFIIFYMIKRDDVNFAMEKMHFDSDGKFLTREDYLELRETKKINVREYVKQFDNN